MALSRANFKKATKHVDAWPEMSRDGGSNPPASSLRSPLWSADEACHGGAVLIAKPGLSVIFSFGTLIGRFVVIQTGDLVVRREYVASLKLA